MPLLKFECGACRKVFDELVRPGQAAAVVCPSCGSSELSRHYQGKCYFGRKSPSDGSSSCGGGSCSGCKGCGQPH